MIKEAWYAATPVCHLKNWSHSTLELEQGQMLSSNGTFQNKHMLIKSRNGGFSVRFNLLFCEGTQTFCSDGIRGVTEENNTNDQQLLI